MAFIASRRSQVARLHTNSWVSAMKLTASFIPSDENPTMGGRDAKALKNE